MQKLKVLHVITGLYTGGAESALLNLLSNGLSQRFDMCVFSLREESIISQKILDLGVDVHSVGMKNMFGMPIAMWELRKLIRTFQPDVIQGWMYHGNAAAWLGVKMSLSVPSLVWNVRQSLYDLKREKPLTGQVIRANRLLSSRPQAIIYNSSLARHQHEAFGISSALSEVIPNGFDLDRFCPSRERSNNMRASLGISENAVVVGHVARHHLMKGHAVFLSAAARVARSREDVHFILSGSDVTESNPALLGLVPDDVRARFHFLGERDDVPDLMRAMDIFCLSSQWGEAFPNVLGEAMASAVPCVTTAVGDSPDIVGETGIVVPSGDVGRFENGLSEMLGKTPAVRKALGLAARERVKNNYGIAVIVERYAELYSRVAKTVTNEH